MADRDRTKDEKALRAWQRAERAYAKAIEPYLGSGTKATVSRKTSIQISELRGKADSRLQRWLSRSA